MAVSIAGSNYTIISGCESMSDGGTWTFNKGEIDGGVWKQNVNSLVGTLASIGTNDAYVTRSSGVWDLENKHLRMWFLTTVGSKLESDANGGIQIFVYNGSVTGYWKVSGSTTYPGGWINLVVDTARACDSGTKPADMTQITRVGMRMVLSGVAKNALNTWLDHVCVCDGLILYGDDGGGSFTFDNAYDLENTPATGGYGTLRKFGPVFFSTGDLTIGDSAGVNACDFADTSQVVAFEDRLVNSSLYALNIVGNGTGATSVVLGEETTGNQGVKGCSFLTQGTQDFSVDMIDTDVDTLGIYGCTFNNASTINLPTSAANKEVFGNQFIGCGVIDIDTCAFENNTIIEPDTYGIYIDTPLHRSKDLTFIMSGTSSGVHMATDDETDFDNFQFSGTDSGGPYDVYHSTAGDLTINNVGTPRSNGEFASEGAAGSTTFLTAISINITVQDKNTDPIQNAQVAVYKTSDRTEIMNDDTDIDGFITTIYSGGATGIEIRVRKASGGATKYRNFSTLGSTGSDDFNLLVTLVEDTINTATT